MEGAVRGRLPPTMRRQGPRERHLLGHRFKRPPIVSVEEESHFVRRSREAWKPFNASQGARGALALSSPGPSGGRGESWVEGSSNRLNRHKGAISRGVTLGSTCPKCLKAWRAREADGLLVLGQPEGEDPSG